MLPLLYIPLLVGRRAEESMVGPFAFGVVPRRFMSSTARRRKITTLLVITIPDGLQDENARPASDRRVPGIQSRSGQAILGNEKTAENVIAVAGC